MKPIALVGDYDGHVVAHRAIPVALKLAVDHLGADVSWEWLPSCALRFEPERAALRGELPPLVRAFVAAVVDA